MDKYHAAVMSVSNLIKNSSLFIMFLYIPEMPTKASNGVDKNIDFIVIRLQEMTQIGTKIGINKINTLCPVHVQVPSLESG